MKFKVMSFNIRNGLADDGGNSWNYRRHLMAKVIRESNAYIIGLQEVYEFQIEYLKRELPEYSYYSVGREDGLSQGEQCSILWRNDLFQCSKAGTFWLSDTPDVPNSMTWGNRITRICSWVEFANEFRFYNTHWDHESQNARTKSAELIVQALPQIPWLLVGDFNAEPDSPDLAPLVVANGCEFVSKSNSVGTFHDFRGGDDGACIDHMFVGGGVKAKMVKVVQTSENGIYPSDHYPIIFEVELNEAPSNGPSSSI
jgi:endonuclease/exonuclease/phosphatase family metal-dependent hydrolase